MIDAILSRFNATLVARGATQTFQVFDWAYIDDIIIREQAAKEFPLLLELLQQAGLVLNLDKTTVAAPPDSLAAGVKYLSETQPDYPLLQCSLATHFTYLKKNIEFVEDLTPSFLSHVQRASNQKLCEHSSLCRKLSWHSAAGVCRMYIRYVASSWLWFSPLLTPLDKYMQTLAVMQNTHLARLLKLGVPASLPTKPGQRSTGVVKIASGRRSPTNRLTRTLIDSHLRLIALMPPRVLRKPSSWRRGGHTGGKDSGHSRVRILSRARCLITRVGCKGESLEIAEVPLTFWKPGGEYCILGDYWGKHTLVAGELERVSIESSGSYLQLVVRGS